MMAWPLELLLLGLWSNILVQSERQTTRELVNFLPKQERLMMSMTRSSVRQRHSKIIARTCDQAGAEGLKAYTATESRLLK